MPAAEWRTLTSILIAGLQQSFLIVTRMFLPFSPGARLQGLPQPPDRRAPEPGVKPNAGRSVLLAMHPVLEHLLRHGAVVLGRFRDRPIVAFLDPGLVRRGAALARDNNPPVEVDRKRAAEMLSMIVVRSN